LAEPALQILLKEMRNYIAHTLSSKFKIEELWDLYEDIRGPFSPIKLIKKKGNPVIEFPSVCGETIQVTFNGGTPLKMLINSDGSVILTPRINEMLLKL